MAKKSTKKVSGKSGGSGKPPAISGARGKPRTKGDIYNTIAAHAGITRKQASQVFEIMGSMIAADLRKGNAEVFNVPGLMKVQVRRMPATKATMRPNPFKPGEMMEVKAKPARNVVKVRALKGLKDLVA